MTVQQVQLRNFAPDSDQHSTQLIGRLLIAAGTQAGGRPAASAIENGSGIQCSPVSQVQYAVPICVIVGAAIG